MHHIWIFILVYFGILEYFGMCAEILPALCAGFLDKSGEMLAPQSANMSHEKHHQIKAGRFFFQPFCRYWKRIFERPPPERKNRIWIFPPILIWIKGLVEIPCIWAIMVRQFRSVILRIRLWETIRGREKMDWEGLRRPWEKYLAYFHSVVNANGNSWKQESWHQDAARNLMKATSRWEAATPKRIDIVST